MAQPAVVARVMPPGNPMPNGFRTTIAFFLDPNISFWEKQVKPPGYDGGDAIDTTTMFNLVWRTYHERKLFRVTDASATVAYEPDVYPLAAGILNRNDAVTVLFPDLDTLTFWGFLKSFEPNEMSEGNQPEASIVVVATNWDPYNCVEGAPNYIDATGTHC